jgi:hypothetical protein
MRSWRLNSIRAQMHNHTALLLLLHTSMVLKLFGYPRTTCTPQVAIVLVEKKVPFEFVSIDLTKGQHKAPEYLAHQPFGQLPYIVRSPPRFFPLVLRQLYRNYTGRRCPHPLREPRDMSLDRRQVPQPGHEARPHRCEGKALFEQAVSEFDSHGWKTIIEQTLQRQGRFDVSFDTMEGESAMRWRPLGHSESVRKLVDLCEYIITLP